jgi:hypothetical protein
MGIKGPDQSQDHEKNPPPSDSNRKLNPELLSPQNLILQLISQPLMRHMLPSVLLLLERRFVKVNISLSATLEGQISISYIAKIPEYTKYSRSLMGI